MIRLEVFPLHVCMLLKFHFVVSNYYHACAIVHNIDMITSQLLNFDTTVTT
jgi:hypothetical protein